MIAPIDGILRVQIPRKNHQPTGIREFRHFKKIQWEGTPALLTEVQYPGFWPEANAARGVTRDVALLIFVLLGYFQGNSANCSSSGSNATGNR